MSNQSLSLYTQDVLNIAYRETIRGQHVLKIAATKVKPRLSDTNIAGYILLRDSLVDMTPREVKFCATMYEFKYENPSEKQLKWLASLLDKYQGISIEDLTDYETEEDEEDAAA